MKYEAYWIFPDGHISPLAFVHHIDVVIDNPEKFGYTGRKIKNIYKKHKEPLHHEGYAREEIMSDLIERGWIRIRYHSRTDSFTIQLKKLDKKSKGLLKSWAIAVSGDIDMVNKYTGIKIMAEKGNTVGTLNDLKI